MAKEISQLLKEATQGILTDETLSQIQEAFDSAVNERVDINVKKALLEQDAEYSTKLEQMLVSIDTDHKQKLNAVLEAQDSRATEKLKLVVEKYKKIINEDAQTFKSDIIDKISHYIDLFLENKVPQEMIEEAVKNTKSAKLLEKLRSTLAIDSALINENLRTAIVDGKQQIETAKQEAAKAKQELVTVKEGLEKTQADLILESKTQHLSEKKKEYAKKVLAGKSPKFIIENIDYTLSLFDKKQEERLEVLQKEAFESRTVQEDAPVQDDLLTESNSDDSYTDVKVSDYLGELSKY